MVTFILWYMKRQQEGPPYFIVFWWRLLMKYTSLYPSGKQKRTPQKQLLTNDCNINDCIYYYKISKCMCMHKKKAACMPKRQKSSHACEWASNNRRKHWSNNMFRFSRTTSSKDGPIPPTLIKPAPTPPFHGSTPRSPLGWQTQSRRRTQPHTDVNLSLPHEGRRINGCCRPLQRLPSP